MNAQGNIDAVIIVPLAKSIAAPQTPALRKRSCGQSGSFQDLILKGHAFGIVFLQPFFCGVLAREDLKVIDVANLLARIDVNPNGHWSLFSFLLPQ